MTSDEGIMSDWLFLFSLIVELTLEEQPVSSADPTSWTYFVFDKNSSLDHCKRKVGGGRDCIDVLAKLLLHGKKGKAIQEGLDPL